MLLFLIPTFLNITKITWFFHVIYPRNHHGSCYNYFFINIIWVLHINCWNVFVLILKYLGFFFIFWFSYRFHTLWFFIKFLKNLSSLKFRFLIVNFYKVIRLIFITSCVFIFTRNESFLTLRFLFNIEWGLFWLQKLVFIIIKYVVEWLHPG